MAISEELQQIASEHQALMDRANALHAKLGEVQMLPQAVNGFAEPIAALMEAIISLNEQVTTLAKIVSAPRKYLYREDGMPVASVPDMGDET